MTKTLFTAAAIFFALAGYASAAVNPSDVANDSKAKAGTVGWYLTPSTAVAQGNEPGVEPIHNQE